MFKSAFAYDEEVIFYFDLLGNKQFFRKLCIPAQAKQPVGQYLRHGWKLK